MWIGAQLWPWELQSTKFSILGPGHSPHIALQMEHSSTHVFMWTELMGSHLFHLFYFYFYGPVSGIIPEDMWITWLSTEAGIKEPFGPRKMMPRLFSLSASTTLSGFYTYCKSARVTHLLTLRVYRYFYFCNICQHVISVCALYVGINGDKNKVAAVLKHQNVMA
jgi:hypothetical protein